MIFSRHDSSLSSTELLATVSTLAVVFTGFTDFIKSLLTFSSSALFFGVLIPRAPKRRRRPAPRSIFDRRGLFSVLGLGSMVSEAGNCDLITGSSTAMGVSSLAEGIVSGAMGASGTVTTPAALLLRAGADFFLVEFCGGSSLISTPPDAKEARSAHRLASNSSFFAIALLDVCTASFGLASFAIASFVLTSARALSASLGLGVCPNRI